jgi:prephenate dehydrogenase
MRLAILGLGLIGGSIGLAARHRLGAEVVGFDPDPAGAELALEREACDRLAADVAGACDGAEAVFCAAPVHALPALVGAALEAAGPDAVVSDAGSVKRGLVEAVAGLGGADRFIGGHPLAGAETAGAANARADLFEGARWYLTPTAGSRGTLYDRLHGIVSELGARPEAIDAGEHDRTMATISHLPHVLANALAERAAKTLIGGERRPEVGRSFRDATRVAGANPAIWADIFTANRDAVVAEVEAVAAGLREAATVLAEGDHAAIAEWQASARERRQALLGGGVAAGPLRELRITVENRPGTVAEIALALGEAGVNIEDMSLFPAPDRRSGAISLWIAGSGEAERAAEVVRGLGHAVAPGEGG